MHCYNTHAADQHAHDEGLELMYEDAIESLADKLVREWSVPVKRFIDADNIHAIINMLADHDFEALRAEHTWIRKARIAAAYKMAKEEDQC